MPTMKTIRQASAETGIAYSALRRWILSGTFTGFVKVGTKFLINMDRLSEFLNGCKVDER